MPTDTPIRPAKSLLVLERNVLKTVQFVADEAPEPFKYIPVAHNVQLSPASTM